MYALQWMMLLLIYLKRKWLLAFVSFLLLGSTKSQSPGLTCLRFSARWCSGVLGWFGASSTHDGLAWTVLTKSFFRVMRCSKEVFFEGWGVSKESYSATHLNWVKNGDMVFKSLATFHIQSIWSLHVCNSAFFFFPPARYGCSNDCCLHCSALCNCFHTIQFWVWK